MNQISFPLDDEEGVHIYVDGKPLPGSGWIHWCNLLSSLERSGYWEILTCSCGYMECGGLLPVGVFCVDGIVAWRTYQPLPGNSFCFDKQQMKEAILAPLENLEWRHFFNCDDRDCSCPSFPNGYDVPGYIREIRERISGGESRGNVLRIFDPTPKLLGAICRGDLEAVDCWVGAGADVNHVSELKSHFSVTQSVLQTALTFAPKAERLPIVKSLVSHGADVRRAMAECPQIMFDTLATGDLEIGLYLADKISDFSAEFETLFYAPSGGAPVLK